MQNKIIETPGATNQREFWKIETPYTAVVLSARRSSVWIFQDVEPRVVTNLAIVCIYRIEYSPHLQLTLQYNLCTQLCTQFQ